MKMKETVRRSLSLLLALVLCLGLLPCAALAEEAAADTAAASGETEAPADTGEEVPVDSAVVTEEVSEEAPALANAPLGIYGNGTNGIWINNINDAPYTTYQSKPYGENA